MPFCEIETKVGIAKLCKKFEKGKMDQSANSISSENFSSSLESDVDVEVDVRSAVSATFFTKAPAAPESDENQWKVGEDGLLFGRYRTIATFGANPRTLVHTVPFIAKDVVQGYQTVFVKVGYWHTRQTVRLEVRRTLQLTRTPEYDTFLEKNRERLRLPEIQDFDVNVSLTEKDKEHALMYSVVPKMGMSLEYLHEYRNSGRLPSPSNVRRLGARLVTILEYIHSAGFLHCDVHTGNVLIDGDLGGDYTTTLIGLKWVERYRDRNGKHLPEKAVLKQHTSPRSLSHASLEKRSFARKDDLEMVGWIMIDLQRQKLPCRRSHVIKKTKEEKLKYMKELRFETELSRTVRKLRLLPGFKQYMDAVLKLGFEEEPDYRALKKMLLDVV